MSLFVSVCVIVFWIMICIKNEMFSEWAKMYIAVPYP